MTLDTSTMADISIVVNIESDRYIAGHGTYRPDDTSSIRRSDSSPRSPIRPGSRSSASSLRRAETCACDFTSCCDVGQPTVSHHLRVLRDAGVVTSERRGQWIFYRLAPDVAERLGGDRP